MTACFTHVGGHEDASASVDLMSEEAVLLSQNVKKEILSCEGNIAKKCFCCCLHLFISYLFLYILIVYVSYHDYLLVFIDYFLFQCKVYCIRVIFLYQKVFHTFMCSIDCTTVQYHTIGIDNQSALLLSS